MAAITANVIAAGAAVKGAVDARKSAKEGLKEQKRQNLSNEQLIREQAESAREDILPLFASAQQSRAAGAQGAADIFGQTIPGQTDVFKQGNVAAQQTLLAGLPQVQNALLGRDVDLTGLSPQSIGVDTAFSQVQIPGFEAQFPLTQAQENAKALAGIVTDEDLFRAGAQGVIPNISAADQQFFADHLANIQGDSVSTRFVDDPSQRGFVGLEGGLNPENERKLANLLTQFQTTLPQA